MSADEWRRGAQEGRVVDLGTALEPGDKSRFPGPPSTPTQGTLVEIMNAIRTLEARIDHLTERVDKHDKYITHLIQTTQRDTDEFVDPDMFGASARPKTNLPPYSKYHLISMKVLKYMTTKCSVLENMSPNITRVHKQTTPVTTRNIRPLTVPSSTRGNRATSPLAAPKLVGKVTTRTPMIPVIVSQKHNQGGSVGQLVPPI